MSPLSPFLSILLSVASGLVRSQCRSSKCSKLWQVCNLAVKGIVARVDEHKAITRKEVCQNIAIIKPIVKYVGP